jgi:tellurite resistance protein TerC
MTHSTANPVFWIAFFAVVLLLMAVDLALFHRKAHAVTVREASVWTAIWVALSLTFGAGVHFYFGPQKGVEFFAGYVIEYALSVDNLFVFILLFSYFAVPARLHHKVLFWGILGALVMRLAFILIGTALIGRFHWILYVFGAFLVFTGARMLRGKEAEMEPGKNPIVRFFRRMVPMVSGYDTGTFHVRHAGKMLFTPLALVLVAVETTDLVFATDSIPAVFGVTTDPFIVYTSNVCAILGLRSMYFLLAAAIGRFAYLGIGVGLVLTFIGLKMLVAIRYQISTGLSLCVVAAILAGSILISLVRPPQAAPSTPDSALIRSDSDKK